mmetsp:Transcript_4680/g.18700  ORF Transcript_4680/g.18700 Transcript_4680/m.18700 type:complete len:192 (-) Transcript_4680:2322-2897(-)
MVNILDFEDAAFAADSVDQQSQAGAGQSSLGSGPLASNVPLGIELDARFRERYFGELDGTPLPNYDKVWPRDLEDPTHTDSGVESVYAVAARVLSAITEYETQARRGLGQRPAAGPGASAATAKSNPADADDEAGTCVVIVSHADTLQITQLAIAGVDLGKFSQYRFRNGEVRQIWASPDCLPDPVPLTFR